MTLAFLNLKVNHKPVKHIRATKIIEKFFSMYPLYKENSIVKGNIVKQTVASGFDSGLKDAIKPGNIFHKIIFKL